MDETIQTTGRQEKQPRPGRLKRVLRAAAPILITVLLTAAVLAGAVLILIGWDGLAVVQGWVLVRWAFVEEDAALSAAADGALSGMVSGLGDRWSYYVDEENYAALLERRANQYVGIGVTINYSDERGLYVLAVTANSPAEAGGILPGEVITSVEGVSAAGEGSAEAMDRIAGEVGETRTLTVLDAAGAERQVVLTLAVIPTEIASGELLDSGVGVVTLVNFNSNAAREFKAVTDSLVEQGAVALVFDVRGNGGGYVDQMTLILDYLLPEGVVFRSEPRWGAAWEHVSDGSCIDLPFAVLVDEGTYSAAELFAAELRESAGAYIVGEVTSGKGYSQSTYALINGGAMGLSTSAYYTGSGVSLIGTGIVPDVTLSLTDEESALLNAGALEPEDDPQLQEALRLLGHN